MAQDSFRVLGVDMDLDRHIAICSVLEVKGLTLSERLMVTSLTLD